MTSLNGKGSDLLDRALRDLTPEQRARTLDLVLRLGIDRDDPLFLITLAVGQLQILMMDAPLEWRDTFDTFSTDLEAWTATNLKALEAIANQAEASADLAETSKKLTDTLTALTRLLSEQNRQPLQLKQDMKLLKKSLETLSQDKAFITASLKTLTSGKNTSSISTALTKTSNAASLIKWLLVGLLAINSAGLWFLWTGQQNNAQQLKWLLYKSTRLECKQGVVEKSTPQCKNFK